MLGRTFRVERNDDVLPLNMAYIAVIPTNAFHADEAFRDILNMTEDYRYPHKRLLRFCYLELIRFHARVAKREIVI